MAIGKMEIGAEIGKGWRLFQADMGVLIVGGILATVVSAVTCGLLAGPLMVGMLLIAQRLLKNDPVKPQAGDVFKGFDSFVQALLLSVIATVAIMVLSILPIIGQLAGLIVCAVMMWALVFIAYEKATAIDAIKKVFELAKSGSFTVPLVFAVIASLIGSLGAIVCVVGIFFTLPLTYCLMACCYATLFSGDPEVIEPIKEQAPPPPPDDLRL
ncbi:MAG: hypothetical protein GX565_08065 [Lentisphaerae bacterium]|jgi:hypothetical protein|nr:hypothetical protein [Lentisphaerota bacterium]